MRSKNSKAFTAGERAHLEAVKSCCEIGCNRPVIARGMCQTHYMRQRRAGALKSLRGSGVDYIAARVSVTEAGCWAWTKAKREGYGVLNRDGKKRQAHAFSYEAHVGPIPAGLQVNHKCHNRCCVNPAHLYVGTQKENMADMAAADRGGQPRGERSGVSKLNAQAVKEIRASREIARVLADRFSVSISAVYAVRKGLIWRHVDA